MYEKPNVKFICGNVDVLQRLVKCNVKKSNIYLLECNSWYNMGCIKVCCEELSHDVPNNLLKFEIFDKKGIYIVDTSNVDNVLAKNYDFYFIECNYSMEEIEERKAKKQLNGEFTYEDRVINTHLNKEQCDKFLLENMGENSQYIYCHRHEERKEDYENIE